MKLLSKLKLLFTYGEELEQVLKDLRSKKEAEEREARRYHLCLCEKHQQEEKRSYYSEDNCDYCKVTKELLVTKYKLDVLKGEDLMKYERCNNRPDSTMRTIL